MTTIKTENFTIDISDEKNSDNTRLFIEVEGLGFVTIVKTHEGLIIDVHNKTDSDSISSLALENDDFMTSSEQDSYDAFVSEFEQQMLMFNKSSLPYAGNLIERAIELDLSPVRAVELFYKENPIDLNLLAGIKGECKEFHEEVPNLKRPYLTISSEQNEDLLSKKFDFYMLGDSVVTFGRADGGYALMPVNEDRKQELLSLN